VTRRVFLSGADLVLPDRIESGMTLVIEKGVIADFVSGPRDVGEGETRVHVPGTFVVPGFVDVHVHGSEGMDVLDGALSSIATRLPRYGVTAFCPTSIACPPDELAMFLKQVGDARQQSLTGARVLPAHLESNFISREYCGAQPLGCLRSPAEALSDKNAAPAY
jgi:N-acetylglucosamine-6-phosphate deacetylase